MSKHLKRLNAPRTIRINRKERTWTVRSNPGKHPLKKSIPLGLLIRDYLKLSDNLSESKNIISNGEVLVDGVVYKDYKYPVGLMDVISIPKLKQDYRVLFDRRGKLVLVSITSNDAKWKLCRVENKKIIKDGKIQINLHDGQNMIVKKDEYKTGDVLKISFKDKKIDDVYSFEEKTVSMITGGSHIGEIANISNIEIVPSSKPNLVKMKGENEFSTLKDYVFCIGKTKPTISLPEVKVQ